MNTVMVVDDDEKIRGILGHMLIGKGFHVIKAPNALEAHRILSEDNQKVDLILLDINMPGIQGDVLYEVMQNFHYKSRVIVSSVLPVEEQMRRIPSALDYYDKADSFAVLIQKIETAFGDPRANKKILIIDDDPYTRHLYRRLLRKEGFFPIDSADRPETLALLGDPQIEIHVVILDLSMPRIDSMTFFKVLRKTHPGTKIIIAGEMATDEQQPFIENADDYYNKADSYRILLDKVRHLTGCGQLAAS